MRDTQKIIIISILILILSQAFMTVLVSNTFESIHVASELSMHAVPQKDFKRKVEAAMRFGKALDNLLGMDALIAEYAGEYDDLTNIAVYSADHDPLYVLHPLAEAPAPIDAPGRSISMPDPLLEAVETEASYLLTIPLFGPAETWMGTSAPAAAWVGNVVFAFDKQKIRDGVRQFWERRLVLGAVLAGCASLLLFSLLFRVTGSNIAILRRRIFFRVLCVVVLVQVSFAGITAYQFHQDHVLLLKDRVAVQLDLLRSDMERVLARGIGLDRIGRMDEFLMGILDNNPEVVSMSIRTVAGEPVARAGKAGMENGLALEGRETAWTDPDAFSLTLPLRGPSEAAILGELRADLDKGALRALIRKILLDSLTVILIASLFMVEQIYFLVSRIGRRSPAEPAVPLAQQAAAPSDREVLDRLMLARFAAFAFLFAFALPVSFVPLQMQDLYAPLGGLPRNIVLGLPISLEMLCALIAALVAGALADRKGWRAPYLAGIVIVALGMALCAQAATGAQFILARGVCGLGYGLSWMSLQSYLFAHSTPTTRAQASSHYVAGIFSGHICGTALGAMLAERFGYSTVFALGTVMALLSLAFFFLFMRQVSGPARPQAAPKAPSTPPRPGRVSAYLRDRNTFLLISCCIIPFAVCEVGLLFFATPLYLHQLGISQADIGRVLMIYGLCAVYIAPQMGKMVDRSERKVPFIAAGGLVGGLGLSLLYFLQGFTAVLAAVFLLGLASSIASSARTAFALRLRATQELGTGKAIAIQRAADKLGQMCGPLALGALMSGMSISHGLVILGMGFMVVSLLFLFLARERDAGWSPAMSPVPGRQASA